MVDFGATNSGRRRMLGRLDVINRSSMNRKNGILLKVLVSLVSLTLTILGLEVGMRVMTGEYGVQNQWKRQRDLLRSAYPTQFSKTLGWVPKAGTNGRDNFWNTRVTILDDGVRANGSRISPASLSSDELILAVGDSFTFGDQVSDDETWPAHLERMIGVPVRNAGVFGYGVDQSFLRMKLLTEKYKPTIVVFSFIPDDITRSEFAERTSFAKPYFVVRGGELQLHDDHILKRPPHPGDIVQRTLGHSVSVHKVMNLAFPEYWQTGTWRTQKQDTDGEIVVGAIFRELGVFLDSHPQIEKLVILAQYPAHPSRNDFARVEHVMRSIEHERIQVVDLREPLAEVRANDAARYRRLFNRHLTSQGNRFVARILAEELNGRR